MLCRLIQTTRSVSGLILRAARISPLELHMKGAFETASFQSFHTALVYRAASRNSLRDGKLVIEKDDLEENLEDPELDGLTSAGMYIPSEETMDSIIGGVPYKELPVAHVKCGVNNTMVAIFDYTGKHRYSYCSAGTEGYRNAKKRSEIAAQETGLSAALRAKKKGVQHVRVFMRGYGRGRLPSIKGIQMAGLKIVSLTDNTAIFATGPRPRKARRV